MKRNINLKIMAAILIAINLMSVSQFAMAETASPPIIQLGSWSLGDTFEVRYRLENFKTYLYSDVQNLYNNNCYDGKSSEISLQNNDMQYQQYCLQYSSLCESIASYKQLIDQSNALAQTYKNEMNTSTDAAIKAIAQQNMQQATLTAKTYQSNLQSAVLQKAEAYTNREQCLFIKNNAPTYRNQQYISQISAFRNDIYGLRLIDSNYCLQGTNAEYAQLKSSAQSISKSKDMSFQSDVDMYSSDYDYYINQQDYLKQQFNSKFEELLNESNITTSQGAVINTDIRSIRGIALMSYASFESNSNMADIKKKQLEDKQRIIDGKITILKEYFSDSSNEVKLAQNEKAQAALELNKWLIQKRSFQQYTYTLYKSKYYEVGINERKAKALYEKYIILLNKYNYGLTNRTIVKEAELSYMQANYNAWNSLVQYVATYGTIERYLSGNIQ